MDYEWASAVGDAGEREVSDVLNALAGPQDLVVLDSVLLEIRKRTAQIDHVVVDRHGIVLVETKVRRGALLKGRDTDKRWTACYPRGITETFQNPLLQNMEHESKLREVLAKDGAGPVDPDFISSIVVVLDADLSHLDLGSAQRLKVMEVAHLTKYFAVRNNFAIHGGDWSSAQVAAMVRRIDSANRASDPAVVARHQRSRAGAQGPRSQRTVEDVLTAPGATGFAPMAARVSETVDASSREPAPSLLGRLGGAAAVTLEVAAVLAICGLVWYWVFFAGGAGWLYGSIFSQMIGATRAAATSSGAKPTVSVAQAAKAFQDAAPEKYAATIDKDKPKVSTRGGITTVTWRYISRVSASTVAIKSISLSFDSAGVLRGASTPGK